MSEHPPRRSTGTKQAAQRRDWIRILSNQTCFHVWITFAMVKIKIVIHLGDRVMNLKILS